MAKLWFNTTGILHDGIGLVLCNTCPCVESSSSVFSDSGSVVSDSCTSSTCVEVPCCPGVQIPTVLNVTFTGGSCPGNYTMIYRPDQNEWTSDDSPPNTNLRLSCDENIGWTLLVTLETLAPDSVSCDPFELVFSVVGNPFCGDFTVTITG